MAPGRVEEVGTVMRERFMRILRDEKAPFATVKALLACTMRQISEEMGLPDYSDRAGEIYRELFTEYGSLYDDAAGCLERLAGMGKTLYLISDADKDVLCEELELFGIRHYFSGFVISSEVEGYKPSKPMVDGALKLCREPKEGIVLVGDDRVDIMTAQRMGVAAITVRCPRGREWGAEHALGTLDELFGVIE